jgi:hypothetical protein
LARLAADGYAVVVNFHRRVVLHRFNFKDRVRDIAFSPDGRFFAVAVGNKMQVWRTPGLDREFSAFVLHRQYTGHYSPINSVSWSPNGLYLVTGSRDMTCRIYSLHPIPGFIPVTLSGHRDAVVAAYFAEEDVIYSVAADGACYVWAWKARPDVHEAAAAALAGRIARAEARMLADGDDVGDEGEEEESEEEEEEEDEVTAGAGAGAGGAAAVGSKRRRAGGAGAASAAAGAGSGSRRQRRRMLAGESGGDGFEGEEATAGGEQAQAVVAASGGKARAAVGISRSGTVAALTDREGGRGRSVRSATDMLASRRPHAVVAPFADATAAAAALHAGNARAGAGADADAEGLSTEAAGADAGAELGAAPSSASDALIARVAARDHVRLTVAHGEWTLSGKRLLKTGRGKVESAALHTSTGLLVLGLSSGVFSIYTMPDGQQVHSLSISSHHIHASAVNASGDWLAFGSATLGQLLVWEWKTETCEWGLAGTAGRASWFAVWLAGIVGARNPPHLVLCSVVRFSCLWVFPF